MINTTLCYIKQNDSYLMLHRTKKENDYNKDKWIGIGGKFENTESPQDCVSREVLEETGIILESNKIEYRGIVTFVSYEDRKPVYTEFMHLFMYKMADDENPKLKDCDEGELEWVPVEKMNDLPHWEGDEIFLDLLKQKVPFFSLKLIYKNGTLIESKLY